MDVHPPFEVPSYGPNAAAYGRSVREGADVIRPKAPGLREQVYQFVLGQGDYGATDQEGQAVLGMHGNTYRPRRWELFHAGRVRPATDDDGNLRYREGAVPTGDKSWRYIHRSRQLIWVAGAASAELRATMQRQDAPVVVERADPRTLHLEREVRQLRERVAELEARLRQYEPERARLHHVAMEGFR